MSDCTCPRGSLRFDCPLHGISAKDPDVQAQRKQASKNERRRTRQAVNRQSRKQAYREGVLHGIKVERLNAQWHDDRSPDGQRYYCENGCGRRYRTLEDAMAALSLHHVRQRSLGARASQDSLGVDDPENLLLVCNDVVGGCHRLLHEDDDAPQWTRP